MTETTTQQNTSAQPAAPRARGASAPRSFGGGPRGIAPRGGVRPGGPARPGSRGGAPRKGGPRGGGSFERVRPEYDSKLIQIRRVTRVVSGGRRFSFSVALVAGNRKGSVGVGIGKAADTS